MSLRKPSTRGQGRPTQGNTPRTIKRDVRLDVEEEKSLQALKRRLGLSNPSEALRAAVKLAHLACAAGLDRLCVDD